MSCEAQIRIFEPLEEYRARCPYVLVTSGGLHTHPIPLPQKTPPVIRKEIYKLLESLDKDLADLTPRRFLRHPVLQSYLKERFPEIPSPTLSDLHISLANREHVSHYIEQAKEDHFPAGTGWEGTRFTSSTLGVEWLTFVMQGLNT